MCAPHVCDDDVLAPPTVRHSTALGWMERRRKTSIGFLFFTTFPFTCRVFLCVWLVTASHTYSIISSWENCETAISVPGRRRLPVGRRVFNWRIYKERRHYLFLVLLFFSLDGLPHRRFGTKRNVEKTHEYEWWCPRRESSHSSGEIKGSFFFW